MDSFSRLRSRSKKIYSTREARRSTPLEKQEERPRSRSLESKGDNYSREARRNKSNDSRAEPTASRAEPMASRAEAMASRAEVTVSRAEATASRAEATASRAESREDVQSSSLHPKYLAMDSCALRV